MEQTINENQENKSEVQETFEDCLEVSGNFGFFQIRLFCILTLIDILNGSCMYYFVFSNTIPKFRCSDRDGFSNISVSDDQCKTINGSACSEFIFEGTETFISEFELVCSPEKVYIPKLATTLQMAGIFVSAIVGGQLADYFGRRKTLIGMATMLIVSQVCTGLANSWQLFLALRFFVGCFIGSTMTLGYTIPIEFIGAKYRPLCSAVDTFEIGFIFLALLEFLGCNWRYIAIISGSVWIPLIICYIIWVPESVRWLIQKGRVKEAENIMKTLAARNKKPVCDLTILAKLAKTEAEQRKNRKVYTYWHLFRNRRSTLWTLTCMLFWFSGSCNLYGLSEMLNNLGGSSLTNIAIASAVALPMCWSIILLSDRFGRKKTSISYISLSIFCTTLVVILGNVLVDGRDSAFVKASAIIGRGAISAAWAVGTMITAEVYPTLLRNMGQGVASTAARIGGVISPQISYLGELTHWTVPYICYTIFAVITAVSVVIFLPETAGKPLPDAVGDELNLVKPSKVKPREDVKSSPI